MLQVFGIIAGALSVVMYIPYIRDILLGKVKPERASWLIWSAIGGIAFFSQLAKGATNSLWLPGVDTIGVFIIWLLAIKYGMGGLAKRDIIGLIFAATGLVLWYLTKEPAIALLIVVAVDFIAGVLSILKTYEHPETETPTMWFLSGTAGLFGALAVGSANYILLAYPIYIILINYAVVVAIFLGKRKSLRAI